MISIFFFGALLFRLAPAGKRADRRPVFHSDVVIKYCIIKLYFIGRGKRDFLSFKRSFIFILRSAKDGRCFFLSRSIKKGLFSAVIS